MVNGVATDHSRQERGVLSLVSQSNIRGHAGTEVSQGVPDQDVVRPGGRRDHAVVCEVRRVVQLGNAVTLTIR